MKPESAAARESLIVGESGAEVTANRPDMTMVLSSPSPNFPWDCRHFDLYSCIVQEWPRSASSARSWWLRSDPLDAGLCSSSAMAASGVMVAVFFLSLMSTKRILSMSMISAESFPPALCRSAYLALDGMGPSPRLEPGGLALVWP